MMKGERRNSFGYRLLVMVEVGGEVPGSIGKGGWLVVTNKW